MVRHTDAVIRLSYATTCSTDEVVRLIRECTEYLDP